MECLGVIFEQLYFSNFHNLWVELKNLGMLKRVGEVEETGEVEDLGEVEELSSSYCPLLIVIFLLSINLDEFIKF